MNGKKYRKKRKETKNVIFLKYETKANIYHFDHFIV